jgi:hypothetical protein
MLRGSFAVAVSFCSIIGSHNASGIWKTRCVFYIHDYELQTICVHEKWMIELWTTKEDVHILYHPHDSVHT